MDFFVYIPARVLYELCHHGALSLLPTVRPEITDSTTLKVVPGESLSYCWEGFGLNLEAPANALDSDVPSQTLNLLNCNIDHFKVPENMELVSGIYWVDFKGEYANPITIEIEHCASLDQPSQFSSLSFVSTKPLAQGAVPYQLQQLPGGVFPQDNCYGSIQLNQSSLMAVVSAGSATKSYRALNYYVPKTTTTWNMDLIIMYDLEISIKVCLLSSTLKYMDKKKMLLVTISIYACVADIEFKEVLP